MDHTRADQPAQNFPQKVAAELSYVEAVLGDATNALADVAGRNHGHPPEAVSRGQAGNEANKRAGMFDQVTDQMDRLRELAHQLRDQAFSLNATH